LRICVSRSNAQARSSLRLYPQPASGEVWLRWDAPPATWPATATIHTLAGQQVAELPLPAPNGNHEPIRLALPALPVGLYLLRAGDAWQRLRVD
jgi:hypothetical protein